MCSDGVILTSARHDVKRACASIVIAAESDRQSTNTRTMPGLDQQPEVPIEAFAGAGGARRSLPGHLKAREAGSLSPASSRLPARARYMRRHWIRKAPRCFHLSPAGTGQEPFTPGRRLPLQGQAIHGHQVVPLQTAGMLIVDKLAPRRSTLPCRVRTTRRVRGLSQRSLPHSAAWRGASHRGGSPRCW